MAPVPLSWIQERMLDVPLAGDPALYVTQVVVPGADELDIELLRAAWQRTGARFAALRTSLTWSPGTRLVRLVGSRPEPVGEHEVDVPLTEPGLRPWLDWRAGLTGLFRGGKLARLDLVRSRGTAVLVFTFNHVIMDGWSMSIVLDHLVGGLRSSAAEPAVRSAALDSPGVSVPNAREARFWARLVDAGTPHPVRGARRSWTDRELPGSVSGALTRCARSARVTPAALLHVVCVLALARCTGRHPPRLVSAVSVRGNDVDDTRAVGCLLAPLPFAIDLPAEASVRSLLTVSQALLVELHARAASYPGFVAQAGPPTPPTVWIGVGNFPVPSMGPTSRAAVPYSVERPGAPLSLFAVLGDRFRFQVVRRGELSSLDEKSVVDAMVDTCALLAEDDTRPVATFLSD